MWPRAWPPSARATPSCWAGRRGRRLGPEFAPEDLGETELRNIDEPVRVFRLRRPREEASARRGSRSRSPRLTVRSGIMTPADAAVARRDRRAPAPLLGALERIGWVQRHLYPPLAREARGDAGPARGRARGAARRAGRPRVPGRSRLHAGSARRGGARDRRAHPRFHGGGAARPRTSSACTARCAARRACRRRSTRWRPCSSR